MIFWIITKRIHFLISKFEISSAFSYHSFTHLKKWSAKQNPKNINYSNWRNALKIYKKLMFNSRLLSMLSILIRLKTMESQKNSNPKQLQFSYGSKNDDIQHPIWKTSAIFDFQFFFGILGFESKWFIGHYFVILGLKNGVYLTFSLAPRWKFNIEVWGFCGLLVWIP